MTPKVSDSKAGLKRVGEPREFKGGVIITYYETVTGGKVSYISRKDRPMSHSRSGKIAPKTSQSGN